MKTQLQKTLAAIAPSVSVQTLWAPDPDAGTISQNCDGFTRKDDNDWQAWQSEVRATTIIDGKEVTGSAHLGGTFERAVDLPEYSNPAISGYEPQMTEEALTELRVQIPAGNACRSQIVAALGYLEKFMHEAYEAQQTPAADTGTAAGSAVFSDPSRIAEMKSAGEKYDATHPRH
jgi:hypothetical protein